MTHASVGLLLSLIVVACTGPTPTPTPAPSPTDGVSFHAFPALEERLPSQLGERALTKVSLAAVAENQQAVTLEVLRRLGRTANDIQLAVATGGEEIQISAFRIVGADGVQIVVAFQAVEEEHVDSTAVYGMTTVAGRRLVTRTAGAQVTYLYPAEDIMFVLAGSPALVEEALGKLP